MCIITSPPSSFSISMTCSTCLAGNEAALQVGQRRVDLQRVQRRVVPGELHQRAVALLHLVGRLAVAHGAAVRVHQQHHCRLRSTRPPATAPCGSPSAGARPAARGGRSTGAAKKETSRLMMPGRVRELVREVQRVLEVVESHQRFEPWMRGRQRDLRAPARGRWCPTGGACAAPRRRAVRPPAARPRWSSRECRAHCPARPAAHS